MLTHNPHDTWTQFLEFIGERCSATEYENWIAPIKLLEASSESLVLEVPNIFVQEYLIDNYKEDLCSFVPKKPDGQPALTFVIAEQKKVISAPSIITATPQDQPPAREMKLNPSYTFENFIEGPANQFVKSAALGVAGRPGRSYNPLFIHGGVGLGKTHLLHAIGHYIKSTNKKTRIQCITTEGFINDIVDNLRNKSIDQMKKYYRTLDVLLVDDIQFLQNRLNFEDEMCNTFETLINQNKQIIITSDKPPGQLKLSERMVARMEWGLVANVGIPDLETRVAILQYKAEQKGLRIPQKAAFFIAEHIFNNVRQLEGAINRLNAYCRLMNLDVTEEVVEKTLSELFQTAPQKSISVEAIIKSVAAVFEVRVGDLRGDSRQKEIAFPRQVAMYLAKEMMNESLIKLASYFGGKTHSTLLHAWKKVALRLEGDETLRRQVQMVRRNLES
ncbi:MAG: chromosomal replication initiator protein DnaA [Chlamydiales bacterium]|nr:chromosomal replication initiator protein DnaA [Chlamydiales bacterium]